MPISLVFLTEMAAHLKSSGWAGDGSEISRISGGVTRLSSAAGFGKEEGNSDGGEGSSGRGLQRRDRGDRWTERGMFFG